MIEEIVWNKKALIQAKEIKSYLEENYSEKTAAKFVDNLEKLILKLKKHPEIGRESMKVEGVRQYRIDAFNRLYYKIDEESIVILLIYGEKQNPEKKSYS